MMGKILLEKLQKTEPSRTERRTTLFLIIQQGR